MRKRVALAAFVMLGACGQKSALQPVEGAALPPAPYGAAVQPTADELLAVEPTAAPDRSVLRYCSCMDRAASSCKIRAFEAGSKM